MIITDSVHCSCPVGFDLSCGVLCRGSYANMSLVPQNSIETAVARCDEIHGVPVIIHNAEVIFLPYLLGFALCCVQCRTSFFGLLPFCRSLFISVFCRSLLLLLHGPHFLYSTDTISHLCIYCCYFYLFSGTIILDKKG